MNLSCYYSQHMLKENKTLLAGEPILLQMNLKNKNRRNNEINYKTLYFSKKSAA